MKRKLAVLMCIATAVLCLGLVACGGESKSSSSSSPAASSAKAAEYDLTTGSPSSDTIKAAFNTSDKSYVSTITLEGTWEAKTSNSGEQSYVIHLYIDGKDYQNRIYCSIDELGSTALPENGTMVTAHGTWRHIPDSSNDTAFYYYLDKLAAK